MPIWKVLNSVMLIILKYDALVDDWIQRLFFVNFCSSRLQISLKTYLSYKSISFNHYFPLYILVCFALRYMLIKNFSLLFRNIIYISGSSQFLFCCGGKKKKPWKCFSLACHSPFNLKYKWQISSSKPGRNSGTDGRSKQVA